MPAGVASVGGVTDEEAEVEADAEMRAALAAVAGVVVTGTPAPDDATVDIM